MAYNVTGSGKSMTAKNAAAVKAALGKERALGKKERRPSHTEDAKDDEEFKPWNTAQRPAGAFAPQDNSFCIEDEATSSTVEGLMYSLTISDPQQKGNPLVFVSPGFETLTGYSSEELLGANCKVLQGKAPDKDKSNSLKQGLRDRHFTAVEITNYRKDGKAFQNLLCILPFFDTYDNLLRFVGVQCDLDDKKRREHVDEHFTAKWQEQVHHYLTAFMLTDNSADSAPITAVSPGFTALTGYSQSEVLGCSCLCLAGPDSSAKAMRKWITSQWADKPVAVKVLSYKKDGTPFWAYVFSCPLTAARGSSARQTLCLVLDITSGRLKRVGKYVLGKVIGSGAYGIVRLGKVPGTDEVVAIKSVDASRFRSISEIEQIQEEMNVLSSLKHPNIIRLIEIHFISQIFFMVMEFASGGSLIKYIRGHPHERLPEAEAHRLFMQIVSGMDYCHRRRVIHRDLKPENILMDERCNIKVCDFGLAAVAAPFGKGLTQQCGTPEFTAPEITTGKEYDGPSVDIWSMGIILYEAVSGTLPFSGATQSALFKAIQKGVYAPPPPNISTRCINLIKGMLRVDTHSRLTMDEVMSHPWCRGAEADNTDGDSGTMAGGSDYDAADDDYFHSSHHSGNSQHFGGSHRSLRRTAEGDDDADSAAGRIFSGDGGGLGLSRGMSGGDLQWDRPGGGDLMRPSSKRVSRSGPHDSVRLVFEGDGDKDDPITAAIMRAQMATLSILSSTSNAERGDMMRRTSMDRGGGLGEDVEEVIKPSATSFSRQKALQKEGTRDMTPTRLRDGAQSLAPARVAIANSRRNTAAAAASGGPLPPLTQGSAVGAAGTADRRRGTADSDSKTGSSTQGQGSGSLNNGTLGRAAAGLVGGAGGSGKAAANSKMLGGPASGGGGEGIAARRNLPPITKTGSSIALNKLGK